MKNLVNPEFLYENMDNVVIIDATNNFMDITEGKLKYSQRHIKGAFHIDLRDDMSKEPQIHGGRDPLPEKIEDFGQKLESLGINSDTQVVVYDENMVSASRFWWMCKYIGINHVKVLNGGLEAWMSKGYPVTNEPSIAKTQGKIHINLDSSLIADIEDIKRAIYDENSIIVDCRSEERYSAKEELIDKVAGHIPTAVNYFFGLTLEENNTYKSKDFLKKHFENIDSNKEIICQCGSGVSAPVNMIALDEIGIKTKLYVGSWSDYITYEDSEIVK